MDCLPVEWAFLGKEVGASEVLWLIVPDQAVKIECIGILWLLNTIIEPACDDRVSNSTEFLRFSLSDIELEVILGQ